jgi:RHS repeat-associated protein
MCGGVIGALSQKHGVSVGDDSQQATRIAIPNISVPSGHGALGYGETFHANPFTGTAGMVVPLFASAARDAEPRLELRYTSGGENGVFGLGWSLPLPSVSRRTDLGIPRYAGHDAFVLADGSLLTPRYEKAGQRWLPAERTEERGEKTYFVVSYRRNAESAFDVIEQWTDPKAPADSFWQIVGSRNERTILGSSPQCRIADPADPERIWRWLVEEQVDAHGNRTVFDYFGDEQKANRYLGRVGYGPYRDSAGTERLAFAMIFDYGERDLAEYGGPPVPRQRPRPDPFSSFRAGFEIRTDRLCRGVLVVHDLPDEVGPEPAVISATTLDYDADAGVSLLGRVQRTGRRIDGDGGPWTMPLPPLTLRYTSWTPHRQSFRDLRAERPGTLPAPLDDRGCQLVDLYADGLPGVLTVAPPALLYARPLGDGRFAPPVAPPVMPVHPPAGNRRLALMDITGSGPLDLVVAEHDWGGYYGNEQGDWRPFANFREYPAELADPLTRLVDLDGDGRPDLLAADEGNWRVTLGAGRAGFTDPVTVAPPPGIDLFQSDAETVFIGFADMFGDGLSHLVRVRDGNVQVWPCLGYGRFGDMREIPGAPRFGPALTAARILLADVDGDGAVDLVFVYQDRVELHRNRFGDGFDPPVVHPLPDGLCALDQVLLADVYGQGTAAVVVSDAIDGGHRCLDYVAQGRPYLLSAIENELGASTRIEYRSSTDYALADRAAGQPWVTSLPFPVQVVARVEMADPASAARLDRVFQYRDGYFDPIQRQFRGFGLVQTQDHPAMAAGGWHFPAGAGVRDAGVRDAGAGDVEEGSQPLLRKTWSQPGAFQAQQAIAAQLAADSFRLDRDALVLPQVRVDPAIVALGAEALVQAWYVLAGQRLREENYGVTADGQPDPVPYQVAQATPGVVLVQPPLDGHLGVYQVVEWESAVSEYDPADTIPADAIPVAADPRIEHRLNLEFDDFGHPLRTAHVAYARRAAHGRERLPEQRETQLHASTFGVANHVGGQDFHVIGVPVEGRDYWVSGFVQPIGYLHHEQVAAIVADALSGTGPVQAHLTGWWQELFWDETLTRPLPLSEVGPLLLAHHRQTAVLPDALVAEVYGDRVDAGLLRERGGYRHQDGHWWSWDLVAYYEGAAGYYRERATEDPFGNLVTLGYDDYALELTSHTDALGQATTAVIDYQALAPASVTDINANVTQALYDPLGRPMVVSLHGVKDGRLVGDDPLDRYRVITDATAEQVLRDPHRFLQGAGTYIIADLPTTRPGGHGPARTITLRRRQFPNPEEAGSVLDDQVAIEVLFFDAFSRSLGTATLLSAATVPSGDAAWVFTDVLRYDNKGEPFRRYLPYLASTPAFVVDPPAPCWRVWYDALGREAEVHTPDGFLTRTTYRPWGETYWDEDDTVLESPYYREHAHDPHLPPPEREALEAAVRLSGTPTVQSMDVFGRTVQVTAFLVDQDGGDRTELRTYRWLNARGDIVATADPRFTNPEDPDRPRYYNALLVHDLTGRVISARSCDAGDVPLDSTSAGAPRLILRDALDAVIEDWDQRGFRVTRYYDTLRRPVRVHVTGDGLDQDTERIRYGADAQTNTVNRVVERYDQAGVLTYAAYALTGGPAEGSRRYRTDDRTEANWDDPDTVPMEPRTWTGRYRYDALGELETTAPLAGLEVVRQRYDNGWVRTVSVTAGAATQAVVADVTYQPQGAPELVHYGDGAVLQYRYSPANQRLTGITGEARNADPVLRLGYTYDPVGNVTHIENTSVLPEERLPGERLPGEPGPVPMPDGSGDFRYDSLYRLRSGTGRQRAGLMPDSLPAPAPAPSIERYEERYWYDHSGNLTSVDHTAGTSWTRTTVISPSSNHGVPSSQLNGRSPDDFFDPCGNLTELDTGAALGYDYAGRMTSAALAGTTTWSQYDHSGLRARRTDESLGAKRDTLYVGDLLIERGDQDQVTLRVPFGNRLAALLDIGQDTAASGGTGNASDGTSGVAAARYQFQDRLGSVGYELDGGGDVVSCEEYLPYGSTALLLGAPDVLAAKRYRYSGKELDPSTGLYDYGLRYYIPGQGRWTTPDPAGEIDGLNLFGYVRGNPVTVTDPTGENGDDNQPSSKPVKKFSAMLTLVNAFAESFTTLGWARTQPFDPATGRLVSTLGVVRAAGFGALGGGLFGVGYFAVDIRRNGLNAFNFTSLVGNLGFAFEGVLIYLRIGMSGHAAHAAHVLAGRVGFASDFAKIPKTIKDKNYGDTLWYTGLGLLNLRSTITFTEQQMARTSQQGRAGAVLGRMMRMNQGRMWLGLVVLQVIRTTYETFSSGGKKPSDRH